MSNPQSFDLDRVEQMANAVIESLEQLKISIETSSTRLNAAMLHEQTLGTATPESRTLAQANCIKANAKVILALYKYRHPQDCSAPTIIIADQNDQVCARVVRTYYDKSLAKGGMVTIIKGPSCASEFETLESLYKLSRAGVGRAITLSRSEEGFITWLDLDLPC